MNLPSNGLASFEYERRLCDESPIVTVKAHVLVQVIKARINTEDKKYFNQRNKRNKYLLLKLFTCTDFHVYTHSITQ